MDDPNKYSIQQTDIKNVLPDVVHSQQIPVLGAVVLEEAQPSEIEIDQEVATGDLNVGDSEAESISEHIPSKVDYSVSESLQGDNSTSMLKVNDNQDRLPSNDSLNIAITPTPRSENLQTQDESKQSCSLPIDINAVSDIQLLSEESPLILPLSSDRSNNPESKTQSSDEGSLENESPKESPRSEYIDSLNEETSKKSSSAEDHESVDNSDSKEKNKESSSSEEIIKLDIRGKAAPKFPLTATDIIFGPPPEGSTVLPPNEPFPVFQNLLSPFLVSATDIKIDEVFDYSEHQSKDTPQKSNESSLSKEQSDLLVEEMVVDCEVSTSRAPDEGETAMGNDCEIEMEDKVEDSSLPTQPKSMAPEETMSFSTLTTDYKTICEEYHVKLVHLEDAITQRDQLIEDLTVSLQRSAKDQHDLKLENEYLTNEVQNLQHIVSEQSVSDHDTIKAQISDFMKYQSLVKDDSTKFYSALLSGGSSIQSSNGEKDMDREEITVNHSRSDLKTSESSEDFQVGFENKLICLVSKFDEYIEENMRNKLREGLIQILCDEIGKMKLDFDTDLRELENQMQQDQQAYTKETNHLRELLTSVKAGNVDIDTLRKELNIKHEKEMANLRMYFEKKCSDLEKSYSEEVWRGRSCGSPAGEGGGDARARSELPSLTDDVSKSSKQQQQPEEPHSEHAALVAELRREHREHVTALQEQILQLKAQLQTAENTETKLSLYQQDIDLELEKAAQFEKRLDEVRQEVVQELQDKIKVLLSDPDAEVSSWPVELVALRDKIYTDRELSSLGSEPAAETDKWRQRRNNSFDQSRRLEEITKERDGLRLVASQLQQAVGQLLQYCARAEDELNNTVLATLLPTLLEASRPSSPVDQSLSVSRHVHFAPDLRAVLRRLDEGGEPDQRDISVEVRRELEQSLHRLRLEADALLQLSMKKGVCDESRMLESNVQISELVEQIDSKESYCQRCEEQKKCLSEAMSEYLHRESLLREELHAANVRIAALVSCDDDHTHVIAEGYGSASAPSSRARPPDPRPAPPSPRALGAGDSPRGASPGAQLERIVDALTKERDDLQQQLEAANRQLRSTRQFVEEQASEREAERDEYLSDLREMKEENQRLAARLQNNARILTEVEQLESQAREMNQIISELQSHKAAADEALKASEEEVAALRDLARDLEAQLDAKAAQEGKIMEELTIMKATIDERDNKMRSLLQELQEMKLDREQSDVTCDSCQRDSDKYEELKQRVRDECQYLEERLYQRCRILERAHEVCSQECSEPSEDMSIRDQKHQPSLESPVRLAPLCEFSRVCDVMGSLTRAEDAALKRIADAEMQRDSLKAVAQEIRLERDVLQARMSEQALRIASLSARLDTTRSQAAAAAHAACGQVGAQLHDANAEVQRLKEELESKDKQLARTKQALEERTKQDQLGAYAGTPKDKLLLERELSSAQTRVSQLEALAATLQQDKEELQDRVQQLEAQLADREEQINQIMAIKLDEEQNKSEVDAAKISARTLSDIVSISDFDEQDQQMRRAELKAHNLSLSGAPYVNDTRDKSHLNRTTPLELTRPNMSSLNIDYHDQYEANYTPRADSLPAHLTSTQTKEFLKQYKRNVNEITVFGDSVKHSTAQKIPDNCSIYPNRDVSDTKNVTIEPKKINFSLEASKDNKNEDEYTSLRELGITLDVRQENFPDILTQLKHEVKKSRTELEKSKSALKNAEEQLCEFPALKEEVEELKSVLENTMATMENDKKFYENQLESFSSNKKLLEQRLAELSQEVSDKTKDLHLLKEDILRRENMILELAKEKRNLTNKLAELELKIDELERANTKLDDVETENLQLKEKLVHLQKLEQLISEKNQQIDSLNQHLDRLDDLQRCLNDKTEELDTLKQTMNEKNNEVFQLQNTVEALTQDIAKANEENSNLNIVNEDLKQKLTKLEKEQDNASLKLQTNDSELQRLNAINAELTSKIDELKLITDKLKDKETEVEILNEDINSYHEEIATLKQQLQMVSRSPSPRNKAAGEDKKQTDRQASNDKKQLVKIRKQISLLQHELDFHKKELNDKAFELAKAKLDVTELRNNLSSAAKISAEQEVLSAQLTAQVEGMKREMEDLKREKGRLEEQLANVGDRLREESNVQELQAKLREKVERCHELEAELDDMREVVDRLGSPPAPGRRSPTAELESAVRAQLQYSRSLDCCIMDQVIHQDAIVPPLDIHSESNSSVHSSSSDRVFRLKADNEKLSMQIQHLQDRLRDKDALIAELNDVRDKLVSDWQGASARLAAERDNCERLEALLQQQRDTAHSLQDQDSSMIQILSKRLESAMRSEAELREREQLREAAEQGRGGRSPRKLTDSIERLKGEVSILRSRLECERDRATQLQSELERARNTARRELEMEREKSTGLVAQLATLKRQKHESSLEQVRLRDVVSSQRRELTSLHNRLAAVDAKPVTDALYELEGHKSELSREIASLRQYIAAATSPQQHADTPALGDTSDKDHAIRYLHGRCVRLESCRKALVWQKRYLLRVVGGYEQLERGLLRGAGGAGGAGQPPTRGKARFKVLVVVVVAVSRLQFLVRRRRHVAAPAQPGTYTPISTSVLRRGLLSPWSARAARGTQPGTPSTPLLINNRGEGAAAGYIHKLTTVSRCLQQAMEGRDLP